MHVEIEADRLRRGGAERRHTRTGQVVALEQANRLTALAEEIRNRQVLEELTGGAVVEVDLVEGEVRLVGAQPREQPLATSRHQLVVGIEPHAEVGVHGIETELTHAAERRVGGGRDDVHQAAGDGGRPLRRVVGGRMVNQQDGRRPLGRGRDDRTFDGGGGVARGDEDR
jgi:hypothetical protein